MLDVYRMEEICQNQATQKENHVICLMTFKSEIPDYYITLTHKLPYLQWDLSFACIWFKHKKLISHGKCKIDLLKTLIKIHMQKSYFFDIVNNLEKNYDLNCSLLKTGCTIDTKLIV